MNQDPHDPSPRTRHRLLVADDDGHIREVLRYALEQAGYRVCLAADGVSAYAAFERALAKEPYDLLVLDIMMPGLDGIELCRRVRAKSTLPLIFVSSRDEELDRILGLELGADDYITKPFSPRELVARVKATLRRHDEIESLKRGDGLLGESETELVVGTIRLDRRRHECHANGRPLVLTVSEFALLEVLLRRPGQVLSRSRLAEQAYGPSHFVADRTIDSHVRRIRKKLKEAGIEPIETVYGVGFVLSERGT